MGDKTRIAWCDSTWNPVTGCSPVSAGCLNCYAEPMARRLRAMGLPRYRDGFAVRCHEDALDQPLRWRRPRKIFVCSMSDLFHEEVPFAFIDRVMESVAFASQHTFLVLTKRPARMAEYFGGLTRGGRDYKTIGPYPNLWLGVTSENQEMAQRRIPILLQVPAAIRFVSIEPMLSPISLGGWIGIDGFPCLDWVIAGGEKCREKARARRLDGEWIESVYEQCRSAVVPFFFKQWGTNPENILVNHRLIEDIREFPPEKESQG